MSRPADRYGRTLSVTTLVIALACTVAVISITTAVWAAGSTATAETPAVRSNVSETYDSIDGLNATRTTVVKRNGTVTARATYDVTTVPGSDKRRLRLKSNSSRRYDLRVSNGSTLWLHDRSEQAVTRIGLQNTPTDDSTQERIERVLVRTRLVSDDSRPSMPVEPLPVVPGDRGGMSPPHTVPNTTYDIRYTGTETLNGREAYVINITSPDEDISYQQTLWIDTEWLYPIQRQTTWVHNEVERELTTTYTDVHVTPELPKGTFRFEPGPNTTFETPATPTVRQYDSIGELRSDTTVTVPTPELPMSYELTTATRTEGQVHSVGLQYVNETSSISISAYNFTYPPENGETEVTIDGRQAVLSFGPTVMLSWNCERYRYTVRATGTTRQQLIAVGQSVGCPAT